MLLSLLKSCLNRDTSPLSVLKKISMNVFQGTRSQSHDGNLWWSSTENSDFFAKNRNFQSHRF